MSHSLIEAVKTKEPAKVRHMLGEACNIEEQDEQGMTALLHACEAQQFDIVKSLVESGANIKHKNASGHGALEIARWHGEVRMGVYSGECQRIVKYLKQKGL